MKQQELENLEELSKVLQFTKDIIDVRLGAVIERKLKLEHQFKEHMLAQREIEEEERKREQEELELERKQSKVDHVPRKNSNRKKR